FDDGPYLSTTVDVLDKLEEYGITATFFVVGSRFVRDGELIEETAAVLRRAHDMGCEIANHSKSHIQMGGLEADEVWEQFEFVSTYLEQAVGVRPAFFRAPFLNTSRTMFEVIDVPFIQGIMANDWTNNKDTDEEEAQYRADRVLEQTTDGTIVLLHDFDGNYRTVMALDIILPALLEQGYQFVTVSQLFEYKGVTPTVEGGPYTKVG
ncbi:MAG: polysaccharide deacetylase family protein, partial [Oscillospiraceae bacterium]|nr:polysaccharide deacetylase family protein [Oscillospiraceae bacterium]